MSTRDVLHVGIGMLLVNGVHAVFDENIILFLSNLVALLVASVLVRKAKQ